MLPLGCAQEKPGEDSLGTSSVTTQPTAESKMSEQPPSSADAARPPAAENAWGSAVQGLQAAVTADPPVHALDDGPILVRYWLRNVLQAPQAVEHCGFWPNHLLVVTDQTGQELSRTAQGNLQREAFDPQGSRRKSFQVTLQPGQVDSPFGPYDLRQLFHIGEGTTLLHVRCLFTFGDQQLWSNTLELRLR